MTTEFDLGCVQCDESLARRTVAAQRLGFGGETEIEVAECPSCGGRYFPEAALRRLEP
ncbi:hypothetical protein [Halorussus marinus]|uniref:hypothetical protein n=1 Tax=Halorussus marinus TaxID=2505976 RepID=UPI00142FA27E|nr:hypothetical protein [Halorussus marinus]